MSSLSFLHTGFCLLLIMLGVPSSAISNDALENYGFDVCKSCNTTSPLPVCNTLFFCSLIASHRRQPPTRPCNVGTVCQVNVMNLSTNQLFKAKQFACTGVCENYCQPPRKDYCAKLLIPFDRSSYVYMCKANAFSPNGKLDSVSTCR